jgi:phosphatidylglycerophosphate synthase
LGICNVRIMGEMRAKILKMNKEWTTSNTDVLTSWTNYHCLISFVALGISLSLNATVVFLFVSLLSMMLLVTLNLPLFLTKLSHNSPQSSIANWVTLGRFLIVFLGLIYHTSLSTWLFFCLVASVVILDVVDGFLARKYQAESEFGRVFDMESDAFFVTCIGFYYYKTTDIGAILLLPGVLRYIYTLVVWFGPQLNLIEKKRKYAAMLAGVNFVCLAVGVVSVGVAQSLILGLSILVVTCSFSISFFEYYQHIRDAKHV